jgi:hypothetical protein
MVLAEQPVARDVEAGRRRAMCRQAGGTLRICRPLVGKAAEALGPSSNGVCRPDICLVEVGPKFAKHFVRSSEVVRE